MQALAATPDQDKLTWQEVPKPSSLGSNDVLIKVLWADVNPVDMQKFRARKSLYIPGFSGSGVVVEKGEEVGIQMGVTVAFMLNPSSGHGSYAQFCVADRRAIAVIPDGISAQSAACVPLAGCTAYESLCKLGLRDLETLGTPAIEQDKRLLIVGASGGVGSWATRLARVWHPTLDIVATSSEQSNEWCLRSGATRVIRHDQIDKDLQGGPKGSVDYILCLTEPTAEVMNALLEVIRHFGVICLVVAGASIKKLDLGFLFFKSATLTTETVFSSFRSSFANIEPRKMIEDMLTMVAKGTVAVPIAPAVEGMDLSISKAANDNGLIKILDGHTCGKIAMEMDTAGN